MSVVDAASLVFFVAFFGFVGAVVILILAEVIADMVEALERF